MAAACTRERTEPSGQKSSEIGRVMIIHSYHPEVGGVVSKNAGVELVFSNIDLDYEYYYMDTKRNREEEFIKSSAFAAMAAIEEYNPGVVITFDDNALKYLVMPYLRDADLPIVFAGIDWDAGVYELPYSNTTGMVSVDLVLQMLDYLREYASGERLAWLGSDTLTAEKEVTAYLDILDIDMEVHKATTYDEWKRAFVRLQTESDMLILSTTVNAFAEWDPITTGRFALENTAIPVGCVGSGVMSCSLLGLVKDGSEQGVWAATTALEILKGTKPSQIPITTNQLGQAMLNLDIAEKLDVVFDSALLRNAEIYQAVQ